MSGFKANSHVTGARFQEAIKPQHVAISLDGEPTLYPMIGDLIQEIRRREMTSFLVTNGTMPDRLRGLVENQAEPTNLYVSLYGPDKRTYDMATDPLIADAWERIRATLKLMSSFVISRTVLRLTLVKGKNMHDPEGYSQLVTEANPTYVELKGYSWLGESRQRLPISAMPYQREIREFAREIEGATGYKAVTEDPVSRVVLLTRDKSTTGLSLDVQ